MELRHLRYFCAVADHGSFSEAGRQLRVSQSAISEQIADLEREVGGALLKRASGRTRLTPHGQLFLAEARKTLLAANRAVEITNRSLLGQIGSLSIGFFLWGAGGFFARIIREYRKLHPDIKLSLYEMRTPEQIEALMAGKTDFPLHVRSNRLTTVPCMPSCFIGIPSSLCCPATILWQENRFR